MTCEKHNSLLCLDLSFFGWKCSRGSCLGCLNAIYGPDSLDQWFPTFSPPNTSYIFTSLTPQSPPSHSHSELLYLSHHSPLRPTHTPSCYISHLHSPLRPTHTPSCYISHLHSPLRPTHTPSCYISHLHSPLRPTHTPSCCMPCHNTHRGSRRRGIRPDSLGSATSGTPGITIINSTAV